MKNIFKLIALRLGGLLFNLSAKLLAFGDVWEASKNTLVDPEEKTGRWQQPKPDEKWN
jgi:hypothetical protein